MDERKNALRRELAEVERAMSPEEKQTSDRAILCHVLSAPAYQNARTVFCFVGREDEIDTRPLLERVLADGKRLCVPLCVGKGIMECRAVTDLSRLACGRYGIWEPPADAPLVIREDIDLTIVPCVGAASDGRRLGRGGGYYDRFLSAYRGRTLLLCRGVLLRNDIPREPHDILVPHLVTEEGIV